MAERAHPEDPGFKDKLFGLIKSKYKKRLFERYEFCNKFIKGKIVLDIPCGVGWGTSLLKRVSHVTGIDISEEAITYAKRQYGNNKRNFLVGKMENIPLKDNSIDILICLEGFEHVERKIGTEFIKESKRVMKNKGLMILACPVLNDKGESTGNLYHLCEYPESGLIDIFNRNFRIISLERIDGPDGPEYRAVLQNIKKSEG